MGRCWEGRPEWAVVARAEEALGEPLAPLLVGDRELTRTRDAQLAMFVIGLVVWESVRADGAEPPTAFAGHSLGQLTALVAAGVLDLKAGVVLAAARAEATQRAADETHGSLVALLGASPEQAEAACAAAEGCWVANVNAPGQVVVGGTPAGVDAAVAAAARLGVRRTRPLAVAGAFHTPLMQPAVDELRPLVEQLAFGAGSAPVVANDDGAVVTDGAEWPRRLLDHLVRPVQWMRCVESLRALGAEVLLEPGADTLSGLARRIDETIVARPLVAPLNAPVGGSR